MNTLKNLGRFIAIMVVASLGCESAMQARAYQQTEQTTQHAAQVAAKKRAQEKVTEEEIPGSRVWYTGRGGWDPADRPLHEESTYQPTKNKHRKVKKRKRNGGEAATAEQEIPGSRLDYRGRGGYDQRKFPRHQQQNQASDAGQKRGWFNWR